MASDGRRAAVVFGSELGWMGVVFEGERLASLTFGQRSAQAAAEALRGPYNRPPVVLEGRDEASGVLSAGQAALVARLRDYAAGVPDDFRDIALADEGMTDFERRVIRACRAVGYGETVTYGGLAIRAGSSGAARAVGNVMRANRIPLVVPCHRVVGAGGSLGGYSAPAGLDMKRRLLAMESGGVAAAARDRA